MTVVYLALLLLLYPPSLHTSSPEDSVKDILPDLQGLVDSLPLLVNMLLMGHDFDLGEFNEAADVWFGQAIPELRRLLETFSTLLRMAMKVADKCGSQLDRVEVETSQLIFQGIFHTGEELVTTVMPILDILPQPVRSLLSKDSILNVLNIDFVKNEVFEMKEETVRVLIKGLKSVPKEQRDDGLALLKVVEKMLKLAEEDADYSNFDGLLTEVLTILPAQIQNVQEMVAELTNMQKTSKRSVTYDPKLRHPEL